MPWSPDHMPVEALIHPHQLDFRVVRVRDEPGRRRGDTAVEQGVEHRDLWFLDQPGVDELGDDHVDSRGKLELPGVSWEDLYDAGETVGPDGLRQALAEVFVDLDGEHLPRPGRGGKEGQDARSRAHLEDDVAWLDGAFDGGPERGGPDGVLQADVGEVAAAPDLSHRGPPSQGWGRRKPKRSSTSRSTSSRWSTWAAVWAAVSWMRKPASWRGTTGYGARVT